MDDAARSSDGLTLDRADRMIVGPDLRGHAIDVVDHVRPCCATEPTMSSLDVPVEVTGRVDRGGLQSCPDIDLFRGMATSGFARLGSATCRSAAAKISAPRTRVRHRPRHEMVGEAKSVTPYFEISARIGTRAPVARSNTFTTSPPSLGTEAGSTGAGSSKTPEQVARSRRRRPRHRRGVLPGRADRASAAGNEPAGTTVWKPGRRRAIGRQPTHGRIRQRARHRLPGPTGSGRTIERGRGCRDRDHRPRRVPPARRPFRSLRNRRRLRVDPMRAVPRFRPIGRSVANTLPWVARPTTGKAPLFSGHDRSNPVSKPYRRGPSSSSPSTTARPTPCPSASSTGSPLRLDAAATDAKAVVIMGREGKFSAGFDLKVMTGDIADARRLLGSGRVSRSRSTPIRCPWCSASPATPWDGRILTTCADYPRWAHAAPSRSG